MTAISNNDIARAVYLLSKDKSQSEQAGIFNKVVKFLFRKRLLAKAPEILSQLKKIINQEEGRVIVKVGSAERLKPEERARLEQVLKKRYSAKEVILVESLNPSLLGGLKIEVNDEIIDISIKNKIGKLQEYLTKSA